MEIKELSHKLTICKLKSIDDIDISKEFYFIGKTDEEISLGISLVYSKFPLVWSN